MLLIGPPGTAKSDLVIKFKDALGIEEDDYFEYMLTRLTEPSEIIGAIDIKELRGSTSAARSKLPTAKLVFLDEIFKSNSAILNILLTIINEKILPGGPSPFPCGSSTRRRTRSPSKANSPRQGPLRSQGAEPLGAG